MEEAFFNKDFWRQLVAVLIGAFLGGFLGFGGALATAGILGRGRRQTLARMTRQIIVSEAIHNLITLSQMDRLTRAMQEEDFRVIRTSTFRPRAEILRQFITGESLAALSELEATFLMIIGPQLADLRGEYEEYAEVLHRPGPGPAEEIQGRGKVPYRDIATERLLDHVAGLGANIVSVLIESSCRAKGSLVEDRSKELASKLGGLTLWPRENYLKAFKSSLVKGRRDLDPKKWLVVWEHDWPECPMPVIELRPPRD